MSLQKRPHPALGPLVLVLACAVGAVSSLRSLRAYTDLDIFLDAALELMRGGVDLYRSHPDHGAFGYPHVALLPFVAALEAFGREATRVLYALSLGLATALLLRDLARMSGAFAPVRLLPAALFVFLFARCVSANWTNLQLSLWVAVLCTHGVARLARADAACGGVTLGAATALKLTPGLFLPILPCTGRWRAAAALTATAAFLVLVLPLPIVGSAEHLRHLGEFARAMLGPLVGEGSGDRAMWQGSSASVSGTLDFLLQARGRGNGEPSFHLADLPPGALAAVKGLWSAALLGLLVAGFVRARRVQDPRRWLLQASVVMLATAFFSPLTRTYHLAGALLPGAVFCAQLPFGQPGARRRERVAWLAVALCLALAMSLRQRWLLGRELWRTLDQMGLLHLGLVGLAAWIALLAPTIAARTPPPQA